MPRRTFRSRHALSVGATALLVAAGCGDDATRPVPAQEHDAGAPIVDLVVDANRNGALDPGAPDEDAGEDAFGPAAGAAFLANVDDDDDDGVPDAEDAVVNGAADIADLAPLAVRAWPAAPDGAAGTLAVENAGHVRLFRVAGPAADPASYVEVVDPGAVELAADELREGVRFAIEGREFAASIAEGAWDGTVRVSLTVHRADGAAVGADAVLLRVAPLLLQYNTAPADEVYYSDGGRFNAGFAGGVQAMADAAGVPLVGLDLPGGFRDFDPWTQDFFDVGYTSIPGPGGAPVGLHVAVRSAQPDRTAGRIVETHFAGPDWGTVFVHQDDWSGEDHGYSMNSFGNWDVVPPYGAYPLGRNVWGSGERAGERPDAAFVDFVRAQRVQPEIVLDTSWLLVGHVDEVFSWVQADGPRGWRLLVADPTLAREMLRQLSELGHGDATLFSGKSWIDWDFGNEYPADVTVDEILGDADLMAASQQAQLRTDEMLAELREETGLADDEITPMPFVYEDVFGGLVAHQPGTVNLLHVNGHVVVPDPFGPVVEGVDVFRKDVEDRLGALGLRVFFADDWDVYHRNLGEVHCGTNVTRRMDLRWWESGR